MAESLYSTITFMANIPLWVDILTLIVVIILITIIYYRVSKGSKFKKALFVPLVLVPLGIPGVGIVAKAVKLGSLEVTEKAGIYIAKTSRFKPNFSTVVQNAPNQVGGYIARKNGKVMYVGRAIENRKGQSTSGLRKRLKEHFRCSSSGKKELCKYKDEINLEIIPLQNAKEAMRMEGELIRV